MNLPIIDIPRAVARQHFLDYRRAVRARAQCEDELLMRGYRALSQGRQIISVAEAIAQGGVGSDGLPQMAICRADAERCFVRYERSGVVRFAANSSGVFGRGRVDRSLIRVFRPGMLPTYPGQAWIPREGEARVPLVPAGLRPAHSLGNYFILWEATWNRIAPTDPALLKAIGGGLYIVLAVWNLTELERAVIGLRG